MIVVGAENRPPMLDKSMYKSWQSRMLLYIKGKKNGRMMLESIKNGPLVCYTIEENGQICNKKYAELTKQEQLQDDCDVQATNIVLQGLPPNVYALVNHCQTAKDIWDIVKLHMQGIELSYQERECKLYNEFDKFTSVKGESLYKYYMRFSQLINDMYTIGMIMQQVQVNTKFLNALQPEWSKFVTDVKLAKNLYTTNYYQLYAYLSQHEGHANESRLLRERYLDPLALLDSGLVVPSFLPGDDPIACLNKVMAFMSTIMASHFPLTNNQLRTSSNPRNQATIQDGRVTVQQVQGRQGGQARVVKFYSCQGEGHMARYWIGATDDLDAYNSDYDDISSAKAILMANLLSYSSDVLSEKAQRIKPTLYDGNVISKKHDVTYVVDEEETLILKEESRSKMLAKQNDLILKEKKINISLINYSELNAEDFGKCFDPQKELSGEQPFWLQISNLISEQPVVQTTPVRTGS
ncbi:hypothetical protein Tco_0883758 [Tanacetum coccineum]